MIAILWILFVVFYIAYFFVFFSYTSYIFNKNKFPLIGCIICGIINFGFWYIYNFAISIEYEFLAIILYALLLFVETKIVFKSNIIQTLFITVTFCINLFAKRMALLASLALFDGGNILSSVDNTQSMLIVSAVSFAVSVSTISFARKIIPRQSLDTIISDKRNISFITVAFSLMFITLFVFLISIGENIQSSNLLYHYIVLGIFVINAFAVFIVFAHSLAELRISAETYRKVRSENFKDMRNLKEMEDEAIKDSLTGLYTRDYADKVINKFIKEEKSFFVGFIDLDGLKTVNDIYGHDQGDFYITTVADEIKDHFLKDAVCRYGGDEILIVGDYLSEEEVTIRLVQCYKSVSDIQRKYNVEYSTSISYGVAFRHANEAISAAQLISLADERMYELKKSNKKRRKVVVVR